MLERRCDETRSSCMRQSSSPLLRRWDARDSCERRVSIAPNDGLIIDVLPWTPMHKRVCRPRWIVVASRFLSATPRQR